MEKLLIFILLSIPYTANASCRYGQCEDYDTGNSGLEVVFGSVSFIFVCWLMFSESSPLYDYFDEHKGIGWLCLWLSPLLVAGLYLFLFK